MTLQCHKSFIICILLSDIIRVTPKIPMIQMILFVRNSWGSKNLVWRYWFWYHFFFLHGYCILHRTRRDCYTTYCPSRLAKYESSCFQTTVSLTLQIYLRIFTGFCWQNCFRNESHTYSLFVYFFVLFNLRARLNFFSPLFLDNFLSFFLNLKRGAINSVSIQSASTRCLQ